MFFECLFITQPKKPQLVLKPRLILENWWLVKMICIFFDKFIIKYVAIGKTTQGQEVKFHEIKSRNNHSIS